MMRRPLTKLTLAVTCGALVLGALLAIAIAAGASGGAGAKRGAAASITRTWLVSMSAAPDDLALVEVSFPRAARGQRISAGSLHIAVGTPFGDDYLVAAALRLPTPGVPRMLLLLVNRPSPLLDPVSVRVRLIARHALGAPLMRTSADPLTRPASAHAPSLCNLALHGSPLGASELRSLLSRGRALTGFDAASAVAQAYDVVCGLPFASAFEQAVAQSAVPSSPTSPESHVPAPTPSPAPPKGILPGEGCKPEPGYACPGVVAGASAAVAAGGKRRATAGAH
ncbi:MAG: hypothetical protein ACLP1Q_10665 [Solirubrobacteraceae bacterium]